MMESQGHSLRHTANIPRRGTSSRSVPTTLPIFLEVGLRGSQVEVISGTKSVLRAKYTGFLGSISHHLAQY